MNILFIFAHLDDETILSYGTIKKHISLHDNVKILTLCKNGRKNSFNNVRLETYIRILTNCKAKYLLFSNTDLELNKQIVDNIISTELILFAPDIIYTHSNADLHFEHRLIAEEVLVYCRKNKNNSIKELYNISSPTYNLTYGLHGYFLPNYFVDITQYIEEKKLALQQYNMELPVDCNDIRSVESIIDWNRQFGRMMNVDYCEAYLQIFKLI